MKKVSTFAMVAVLILTAAFSVMQSGRALAANGPADVSVTVMNKTAGSVSLHLEGEGGSFWLNVSASGMGKVMVPEGKYDYHLSTPCGGESGGMNLNVSKVLNVFCDESPNLSVKNRAQPQSACSNYEWWVSYYYKPQYGWWLYGSYARGWTPDFYLTNYYYYYYYGFELRCTDSDPTYDPTRLYWD